jgi:SsrA-binding protein
VEPQLIAALAGGRCRRYNARVSKQSKSKSSDPSIAVNRRARHEYFIEDQFEAGMALEGWEVKSLRAGRVNLQEGYVVIRNGEAWLVGTNISPLTTASTHINPDPTRSRKLLLHRLELNRLIGATERQGYTLIPLDLHWRRGRAKLSVGLAKGKKQFDKRADKKDRDWAREKERLMKNRF